MEEGVPVWITGNFERLLAFFLVLFHVEGAYALLALWLGAKLAASWHRLPTEPYGDTQGDDEQREHNRQIRAGTLCALIAGIVSILIGAVSGLGCPQCMPVLRAWLKATAIARWLLMMCRVVREDARRRKCASA